MCRVTRLLVWAGLTTLITGSFSVLSAQQYRLKTEIHVGGDGGWDFLAADETTRRVYIPHGMKVFVIDADKNTLVQEITDTANAGGIAVASEVGRIFTRHGGPQANLGIIDLKTGKTISKVDTDPGADYIMYEPGQREVWSFNGRGQSATVINAASGKVVATIPLGGTPEEAAADSKANRIYLNIVDKAIVVALDTKAHKIVSTWPIAPGSDATGMAIDVENHRLFIGCRNKLMVMMDSMNGKIIATVPIGEGVDATYYDPATHLAMSSSGGTPQNPVLPGIVTIAKEETPNKLTVVQMLKTADGARTMALDLKTHNIYLPRAKYEPLPDGSRERPKAIPGSFAVQVYVMN
jgi:DNA-binding beta-propeller fold protein YncE